MQIHWYLVNADNKGTCHSVRIIHVSILRGLHRGPEHCISNNIIIYINVKQTYCYLAVFLGLSDPFRRDLTRSEGGLHFKYHLVCRFVNVTLRLHLEFSLSSLTINSHRGRDRRKAATMKPENLSPDDS